MATPTQSMPQGSNITAAKQAVFEQCKEIGRIHGRGKTARLKLAELAVARAATDEITAEDAERMWTEAMQGSADETRGIGGDDPKDTKQRASDLKNFIVLGSNKELSAVELFDNAVKRMANLRSSGVVKNARVWDLMLKFARAQNKEPQRPLTDQEIDVVMADPNAGDKDFVEKIWGARNTLVAANEGENNKDIYTAAELIEEVVKMLGGTRKQKLEAAKKQAKALLDAAKAPATPAKGKGKKKGVKNGTT